MFNPPPHHHHHQQHPWSLHKYSLLYMQDELLELEQDLEEVDRSPQDTLCAYPPELLSIRFGQTSRAWRENLVVTAM